MPSFIKTGEPASRHPNEDYIGIQDFQSILPVVESKRLTSLSLTLLLQAAMYLHECYRNMELHHRQCKRRAPLPIEEHSGSSVRRPRSKTHAEDLRMRKHAQANFQAPCSNIAGGCASLAPHAHIPQSLPPKIRTSQLSSVPSTWGSLDQAASREKAWGWSLSLPLPTPGPKENSPAPLAPGPLRRLTVPFFLDSGFGRLRARQREQNCPVIRLMSPRFGARHRMPRPRSF